MGKFFALVTLLLCATFTYGRAKHILVTTHKAHSIKTLQYSLQQPNSTYNFLAGSDSLKRKHKLIAALLAFPFPCGVFGLHRAYLGTAAKVPFLYFVTVGGCFGVLPFVDFVLILLCKDVNTRYAHNHKVFMWSRQVAQ